jgi:hypothetical protein
MSIAVYDDDATADDHIKDHDHDCFDVIILYNLRFIKTK